MIKFVIFRITVFTIILTITLFFACKQEIQTLNDINDGLIAYYPFNNNANDESGFNNHGIMRNNPNFTKDRFNRLNHAILLSGNNYVDLDNHSDIIPLGSSDFSVSVWVKWKGFKNQNQNNVIAYGGNASDGGDVGFIITYQKIDKLEFTIAKCHRNNCDTPWVRANILEKPLMNIWYHYVAVYDHQNVQFYLNNRLVSKRSFSDELRPSSTLRFGCEDDGEGSGYYFLNGALDDIRIYKRALTSSEVEQLYHENNFE